MLPSWVMHPQTRPIVMAHVEGERAPVHVAVDVEPLAVTNAVARAAVSRRDVVRDVHGQVLGRTRRGSRAGLVALLAVVAAGGGVARWSVGAARGLRRRRTLVGASVLVASALAGAALARWQLARLFEAQPDYEVELHEGDFEIRRYPAITVAQTAAEGPWHEALRRGFERLAAFISGANVARDPRTLVADPRSAPKKLAMTAPVLAVREAEHHVVGFVMPPGEAPETLPLPRDPNVALETLTPRRIAVLRFHGSYDVEAIRAKQEELFALVEAAGLLPIGDPIFAGYDPPWTLPQLRRVEVWLPIAD